MRKRLKESRDDAEMRILKIIHLFFKQHKYWPSFRDLQEIGKYQSLCTVATRMRWLEEDGLMHAEESDSGNRKPRTYRISEKGYDALGI